MLAEVGSWKADLCSSLKKSNSFKCTQTHKMHFGINKVLQDEREDSANPYSAAQKECLYSKILWEIMPIYCPNSSPSQHKLANCCIFPIGLLAWNSSGSPSSCFLHHCSPLFFILCCVIMLFYTVKICHIFV